jgi:hypothetical protein
MNERIKELAEQTGYIWHAGGDPQIYEFTPEKLEKFAELIVAKVLDEVAARAFVSGDRAWSDDVDRPWVELEFGIGKLAELRND